MPSLDLTGLLFGAYFYLAQAHASVLKSFSAQRMTSSFSANKGISVIAVKPLHYSCDALLICYAEAGFDISNVSEGNHQVSELTRRSLVS